MAKFNYFYDGKPISKSQFESQAPENWENELDEFGEYSYGYYRACLIDEEEED